MWLDADTLSWTMIPSAYASYAKWKRWESFGSLPAEREGYFAAELVGIPLNGRNVLELGFGNGEFLEWARSQGATVYGTELINALVASATSRGVLVLESDLMQSTAQFAEHFDLIAAFDVFEHISLDQLLRQLHAIQALLKPSGILLARFPNGQSPLGNAYQNGDLTHRTNLSPAIIGQMLIDTGLYLIEAKPPALPIASFGRLIKSFLQSAIQSIGNRIYGLDIIWSPNVVVRIGRSVRSHCRGSGRGGA
jgi:hypothetical protein